MPKKAYKDKVAFHPYLTETDNDTLEYINYQHRVENIICFVAISLTVNRLLFAKSFQIFSRKLVRYPASAVLSVSASYVMN